MSKIDSNGKLTQSAKEYRIANNFCLFDGGKYPTHLYQKLIEKCKREYKSQPIGRKTRQTQVRRYNSNESPLKPALTIASLNNDRGIKVEGTFEGCIRVSF